MMLYQSPYIVWFTEILCLRFFSELCSWVFSMFSSSSALLCAAIKELWGHGRYELWYLMGLRYRGGRRAHIQTCNNPGNNRCAGNCVLLKLNNSDASDVFWHKKRPTEACSDNGCLTFLLRLKLLQSCAAETEGEKENLNSSNADSWHC